WAPGVLDSAWLGADLGAGLSAVSGDSPLLQHLRAAVGRHPVGGQLGLAVGALDQDVLAETDDEGPAEPAEMRVAPLVAEAAVGEHGHADVLGDELVEPLDDLVLVLVAPVLQLGLAHRLPDQWRG